MWRWCLILVHSCIIFTYISRFPENSWLCGNKYCWGAGGVLGLFDGLWCVIKGIARIWSIPAKYCTVQIWVFSFQLSLILMTCVSVSLPWVHFILLQPYNPKGEIELVFCQLYQDLSSGSILIYFSICVQKAKSPNHNLYKTSKLLFSHGDIENLAR